MKHLIFIALGGAGGALARHWLSGLLTSSDRVSHFPFGTLTVNLLGSFGIGVMYVLIVERGLVHPDWRSVAMVGFLGAFTTFSTFSLETLELFENGQPGAALGYVGLSVVLCIIAVWMSVVLTRLVP
jgi:CrcB protein